MQKKYQFYNFHPIKAAYIHVSDVCNFRCKTCAWPHRRKKEFVPVANIEEKIATAVGLGLKNLIFTGQEVILHPNIAEIVNFSFAKYHAAYITFNTNGLAFCDDLLWERMRKVKKYLPKVYIAVSLDFYDSATFCDWSGHPPHIFDQWVKAFQRALKSYFNISSIDIILKRDVEILKIIEFLMKISGEKTDYPEGLRIIDLLPLGNAQGELYHSLKFSLLGACRKIVEITRAYSGKVHFEGFPLCIHNQMDLRLRKYFIYNFHLCIEKGLPIQYDLEKYRNYYNGPTENWNIDLVKLQEAYRKMFCYLGECRNCYYKNKCYGIQKEYIKGSSKKNINDEIKLLKTINWV